MKFRSIFLFVAITTFCSGSFTTAQAAVVVDGSDQAHITVEFDLQDLDLTLGTVSGQDVTIVTLAESQLLQIAGFPELPSLGTSLHIPAAGTPAVRVISRRERELSVAPVIPSLGHIDRNIDPGLLQRDFGPVYTSAKTYPANTVALGQPFVLGDRRGVNLRLNPVRWDAARGVLLVTEAITIEVVTTGTGGINVLPTDAPSSSREFQQLHDQVFPYLTESVAPDKYSAPIARGRMLIVSDDAFASALTPFRDWKARRGIATDLVLMSETDGTASGLRELVAKKYLEGNGLTWLILVGDIDQVPANVGTYDGSDADSPYAMIVGDDLYPEIFVSRISANNLTQVETQVAKFISYERTPAVGVDAAWYGHATGVASDEGVPTDYERAELLRTDLLSQDYTDVDQIYQGLGASTAEIATALNEGRSLINYLGHGSGQSWDSVVFRNADVAALDNGGRLPWIIDVSCYNGDFARETCFAEAWLQAGTPENTAGAVGMIAASSLAPWTPPTVMQTEVVDLLAAGTRRSLGALYYSGLMKVLDEYAGIPVATQVMEQNIVFGDASLLVRSKIPTNFDAVVPAAIDASGGQLTVTIAGQTKGTVAVTHAGQLLGVSDFTNGGTVLVSLSADLADLDSVEVTVTGANMVPVEAVVSVVVGASSVFESVVPGAAVLHGNYPNPFNPSTQIVFELATAQEVQLVVYDIRGRQVRKLVAEPLAAGAHEITWHGRDDQGRGLPSGIYLYRLVTPQSSQGGRMVLSK